MTATLAALVAAITVAFLVKVDAEAAAKREPVQVSICKAFGSHCYEALRVAWCESRWHPWARNGQYAGLFQVSEHWRRTVPGWGPTAAQQARHAYRVFRLTGSDWHHWACQP